MTVRAVTSLSSRLKIVTTAEGVETQVQLRMIQDLGCTEMQGCFYSRPVPAKDLAEFFAPPRGVAGSAA
jgi:EAL domain-containing protein (putative c-di-GMP-specific phosphodiesterase class I)